MNAARTRSSLLFRVLETQRRAAADEYEPSAPGATEMSFTERYRGTEFETLSEVVTVAEPAISRGRAFVSSAVPRRSGWPALVLASGLGLSPRRRGRATTAGVPGIAGAETAEPLAVRGRRRRMKTLVPVPPRPSSPSAPEARLPRAAPVDRGRRRSPR